MSGDSSVSRTGSEGAAAVASGFALDGDLSSVEPTLTAHADEIEPLLSIKPGTRTMEWVLEASIGGQPNDSRDRRTDGGRLATAGHDSRPASPVCAPVPASTTPRLELPLPASSTQGRR